MTFCQIILKKSLLASVPNNPYNLLWWAEKVRPPFSVSLCP